MLKPSIIDLVKQGKCPDCLSIVNYEYFYHYSDTSIVSGGVGKCEQCNICIKGDITIHKIFRRLDELNALETTYSNLSGRIIEINPYERSPTKILDFYTLPDGSFWEMNIDIR